MAKIHIDILTPKQVLFFNEIVKSLKNIGHEILLTTRKYREVNELIQLKKMNAVVIGEHGGPRIERKLEASLQRTIELAKFLKTLKPDVCLSFSSPEAARASFGLAIPHICINDSPHAVAVGKLTIPLSKKLLASYLIPKKMWLELGATEDMIVQYKAIDQIVWISGYKVDENILRELNLTKDKPIVTVRLEESFATYLLDKVSGGKPVVIPLIEKLIEKFNDNIQILAIPRYDDQIFALKNKFNGKVIIAEKVIDGPSLLSHSSVFVGAGGTMTTEAALLGVPTISCYPNKPTIIEKFMVQQKLVYRTMDVDLIIRKIAEILNNLNYFKATQRVRAKALISKMEDPTEKIVKVISEYC
jgi:predicted glycosyltransferase